MYNPFSRKSRLIHKVKPSEIQVWGMTCGLCQQVPDNMKWKFVDKMTYDLKSNVMFSKQFHHNFKDMWRGFADNVARTGIQNNKEELEKQTELFLDQYTGLLDRVVSPIQADVAREVENQIRTNLWGNWHIMTGKMMSG